MTVYEIVNPSDPYTFVAPSLNVAVWAILILGEGRYAATPVDGSEKSVPLFLFGGAEKWVEGEFGVGIDAFMKSMDRSAVADALDSVLIGRAADRATYEKGLALCGDDEAKKQDWFTHWHDERRSSLNDIGRRAKELAKWLREPDGEAAHAP